MLQLPYLMQRHNTYRNNVYTVYVLEFPKNYNVNFVNFSSIQLSSIIIYYNFISCENMHDYDFGQCTFDEEYDFLFLHKTINLVVLHNNKKTDLVIT